MTHRITLSIGAVILAFWAAIGLADAKKWKNETELSYVQTDGNTEVTTLSFNNLFEYQFNDRLKSAWKLGALYGESDGEATAESYMTQLRFDYKLKEKLYAYGQAGYLTDEFAGIDNRYYSGVGVGYAVLQGPRHFFSGELGLNYALEDYTDGSDKDFAEGRAFALYELAISDNSRFSQSLEYLFDFDDGDNYRINSDTALKVQFNTVLSLKVGYEVRYDNGPMPDTLKEIDTRFYSAIAASF